MSVTYITVKGSIKNGKLEIDLPDNVADGEVELRVAVSQEGSQASQTPADKLLNASLGTDLSSKDADWYGGDSGTWMREQMQERRRRRGTRLSES